MSVLLNDPRPASHLSPGNKVANPDFYEVAASQSTVDCKVEQRGVPESSLSIEEEAHRPDLLLR